MFLIGFIVFTIKWHTIICLAEDPGKPLNLTKFIDDNSIEEGRKAAKVVPFLDGVKSYSGLLTVDKEKGSNLFFWYFPAEKKAELAPLVINLNGYSTSSMFGVFLTVGPYKVEKGQLNRRNVYWQKNYHVLHIDNPVGVGYSYTKSSKGYSRTLKEIATNLYGALSQFYKLFPELRQKDLYLSGTSFAGKYVPAFAYKIFKNNQKDSADIKLKGIALGNPYLDPSQISYGEYLYEHGFIDFTEKLHMDEKEKNMQRDIKKMDYQAFYDKAKTYILPQKESYVLNVTGLKTKYDYNGVVFDKNFIQYVQTTDIRKGLHVGDLTFHSGSNAMSLLAHPYGFSVKPWLEEMLDSVKMLFYNGQRDVAWAYPMMTEVLSSLKWSGADGYRSTPRTRLYNGTELSGYVRTYQGLTDALIFNAGHDAAYNQPQVVFDLFNNFTGYNIS